jgi:hypothetical protein
MFCRHVIKHLLILILQLPFCLLGPIHYFLRYQAFLEALTKVTGLSHQTHPMTRQLAGEGSMGRTPHILPDRGEVTPALFQVIGENTHTGCGDPGKLRDLSGLQCSPRNGLEKQVGSCAGRVVTKPSLPHVRSCDCTHVCAQGQWKLS